MPAAKPMTEQKITHAQLQTSSWHLTSSREPVALNLHIHPDEFLPGFATRIARVGSYRSIDRALRALRPPGSAPSKAARKEAPLRILSDVAMRSAEQMVTEHTLIPFDHGLRAFAQEAKRSAGWAFAYKHALQLPSRGPRLCLQCVEEDSRDWGFSYWRRSHQAYGQCWCTKHHQPLMAASASCWNLLPQEVFHQTTIVPQPDTDQEPLARRIADISLGLLEHRSLVSIAEAKNRLRYWRGTTICHPTFGTAIIPITAAENAWLNQLWPNVVRADGTFRAIEESRFPVSSAIVTLSLARVHADTDDALMSWLTTAEIQRKTPSQERFGSAFWESHLVLQTYLRSLGRFEHIATRLNLSFPITRRHLTDAGYVALGKSNYRQTFDAMALLANDASPTDVARKMNVRPEHIEALARLACRRYGDRPNSGAACPVRHHPIYRALKSISAGSSPERAAHQSGCALSTVQKARASAVRWLHSLARIALQ